MAGAAPELPEAAFEFGCSLGSGGRGERPPQVLRRHERRLAVILGEHVLRLLALPVPAVTDDRQAHALVLGVGGEQLLEARRQVLELGLGGQARLEQLGLHLHLVREVLQRGPFQVSLVLHRRDSGGRFVKVRPVELAESASAAHVFCILFLGGVVLINGHHVLHVVSSIGKLRPFHNPATVLLHVGLLILRNETFRRLMVKAAQDLPLETLRGVVRVAFAVEILRVDPRHEPRVPRHTLIANLVRRTIHPSARCLAHITSHGSLLGELVGAIHRGRTHILRGALLLQNGGAGVHHGRFSRISEIISCLSIAFSGGVPDHVQFEGDMAGVSGNFLSALHL